MNEEIYIPFADIVTELQRLCNDRKTGVLFVATRKNKSAQIMLSNGSIVFIYFFNKRGKAALSLMLEIEAGRFKFQEGSITASPMDLPSTPEILDILKNGVEAQNNITTPDQSENPQTVSGKLTKAEMQHLEETLAKYIGPMATIICEDHLESAADITAAIAALAAEVPGQEMAEQFTKEAQLRLGLA